VSAEQRGEATGGVNDALRSQEQVWRQILSHLLAEEVQGTQKTEGGGLQRMKRTWMIHDEDKNQWYVIKRNIFGNLKLEKINYGNIIHFPSEGDYAYSNNLGLRNVISPPEPPTPQPEKEVKE